MCKLGTVVSTKGLSRATVDEMFLPVPTTRNTEAKTESKPTVKTTVKKTVITAPVQSQMSAVTYCTATVEWPFYNIKRSLFCRSWKSS